MNIRSPPNAVVILPDEVIVEVLSFLEVKYLLRMKCVCKSWYTVISDPSFAKMHLKKKLSTRKINLALLSNKSESFEDCRVVPISRLLESTSNFFTLTGGDYPCYRFNYKNCGDIVGSCNGLVCLLGCSFTDQYFEYSLSFWNPATRTKSDTLVSFHNYTKCPQYESCKFSFGYDNSTDTYKVVLLTLKIDGDRVALGSTAARVFTLGGDNNDNNAWRDIQCFPVVVVPHRFCFTDSDSVYLNNSINWLVCHRYNCPWKNLTIEQFVIVSLDLGTETYTQFLLPPSCNEELLCRPVLSLLMDCICFSYDFKKTHFIIWKMDEFGVEQSWTQFLKISYMYLEIYTYYRPQLNPLCLSENGDTVIFSINLPDQAILYNWRDNRVKKIRSTNRICWSNTKAYVESLISTEFFKDVDKLKQQCI